MNSTIQFFCIKHNKFSYGANYCPLCTYRIGETIVVEGGVKHDQEKPDYSMISKLLMDELAAVRGFGAKKYQRENWRLGFKYNRSIAAALRHIFAFKDGEDLDPESGLSHIAHAVACLEHLMNDIKNNPNNDDRYKK